MFITMEYINKSENLISFNNKKAVNFIVKEDLYLLFIMVTLTHTNTQDLALHCALGTTRDRRYCISISIYFYLAAE